MNEWSVASALDDALTQHHRGFRLRGEVDADFPFLTELYAEVRHDELAPLDWPAQAKRDFLDTQCRLQRDHYAQHYVGADLLIVERGERVVGRVYVHASAREIRLMDIALLRSEQGQGFGTAIVRALQDLAARRGQIELTLHVEPANPAQRLYMRLGFRLIEQRGVYDFLGWKPGMENSERAGIRDSGF
jgi:ribosomal protein S18 acetylase RimI-like enzyme